jgi:hypothetical protein
VVIPPNSSATIFLPILTGDRNYKSHILESGKPADQSPGLSFAGSEGSFHRYAAGSGEYTFTVRLK